MTRSGMCGIGFVLAVLAVTPASAAPLQEKDVPAQLKPWIGWALHGHEDTLCPFLDGDESSRCAWPSRLTLALDDRGGRFTQEWHVYRESWVPLPGGPDRWPLDVRVGVKPAVVAPNDSEQPSVLLAPGHHTVAGAFSWDSLPESLQVPPETGVLSLLVRGARMAFPQRDQEGQIFLERESTQEADDLRVVVHRRVTDDVPLELVTRLVLEVAGQSREVLLGRALPPGFVPLSLEGGLPARLEPDGRVRIQVRPGRWEVTVVARHDGPAVALTRPDPRGPWSEGDEIWAFDARPNVRVVTITGVSPVDPKQTALPDEWKRLPAYAMPPGATMTLVEQHRGDADPAPDRLRLRRTMWLDFDGGGYTMRDEIEGSMSRGWRLELPRPAELGRVTVDNEDQLITQVPGGEPGVEVRQGMASLRAESRWRGDVGEVPAVAWNSDFEQVSTVLQIPPGWRLLHVTGADDASPTWMKGWTLLDLFLLLLTSLAVAKLYGPGLGIVALLAALLSFPEPDAPKAIWLALLAGAALRRLLRPGKLATAVRLYLAGVWVILAIVCVPFVIQQLRVGMHPAVEHDSLFERRMASIHVEAEPEQQPQWLAKRSVESPAGQAQGAIESGAGVGGGGTGEATLAKTDRRTDAAEKPRMSKLEAVRNAQAAGVLGGLSSSDLPAQTRVPSQRELMQSLARIDPSAVVQTGPGVPTWSWSSASLSWTGPVERNQRLRLVLLPPWANLTLAFLRVALLALLVAGLLGWPRPWRRGALPTAVMTALLLALLPGSVRADDVPPEQVLETLRERMLEPPACKPDCASISRLGLEIAGRRMRVRIEAGAAARTAVALPGTGEQWAPTAVSVDGRPAAALSREDGALWVQLDPGGHVVAGEGELPDRDTVQLSLPMKPHHVTVRADGWTVEGVHEDGAVDSTLQLTRVRQAGQAGVAALQPGALPPLVRVSRVLMLGLRWQVETRVTRVSPRGAPIVLEVPLLEGEAVTTAGTRVSKGKAQINMGALQDDISWRSTLEERSSLELQAVRALAVVEEWTVAAEPIWHVTWRGLSPVLAEPAPRPRTPTWRPWPGEKLTLQVVRPPAVPGQTMTIESTALELHPGSRATEARLAIQLRSSRGGPHKLALPAGVQVTSLTVGGISQPLQPSESQVVLPLAPGSQQVYLTWRQPDGMTWLYRAPAVNVGAPGVNSSISIQAPSDRWILMLGGPRLGPTVLFWSLLIGLLLVAAVLGRWSITPLRVRDWLLLGVGLSQVPMPFAALVAGWLIAFGWRRRVAESTSRWAHDLIQIGLVVMTAAAAMTLVHAIRQGLLGRPDMQIAGNDSDWQWLRWFEDRSSAELARPWVLSVPSMAYRVAMLAWALWLATALLRWARWLWGCFGEGGFWKPLRKRAARPEPAVEKPAED